MRWKSPHGRRLPVPDGAPLIMGILNVSSDSFSDGGKYSAPEAAAEHCAEMLACGADLIDIGAESTRPGAAALSEAEELSRLIPCLKLVRERFPDLPISADTYKPSVAMAAAEAGADIFNDVFAVRENGVYKMAEAATRAACPLIATHNCRGISSDANFFGRLINDMRELSRAALDAGVQGENLVLDPGVGFGKTLAQNIEIVKRLGELRDLGFPLLLGVSRKSFLAEAAGGDFAARDAATAAVSAFATLNSSADILRVHDVRGNAAAIKTAKLLK